MDKVLYVLPTLACPLGMAAMMFVMMRGIGHKPTGQTLDTLAVQVDPRETELAELREEIQHLRGAQHPAEAVGPPRSQ